MFNALVSPIISQTTPATIAGRAAYLGSTSRKIVWLKRSSAAFCSKDNSSQTKDSAQAAEVCPITVDERSSIRRDNTGVYS